MLASEDRFVRKCGVKKVLEVIKEASKNGAMVVEDFVLEWDSKSNNLKYPIENVRLNFKDVNQRRDFIEKYREGSTRIISDGGWYRLEVDGELVTHLDLTVSSTYIPALNVDSLSFAYHNNTMVKYGDRYTLAKWLDTRKAFLTGNFYDCKTINRLRAMMTRGWKIRYRNRFLTPNDLYDI